MGGNRPCWIELPRRHMDGHYLCSLIAQRPVDLGEAVHVQLQRPRSHLGLQMDDDLPPLPSRYTFGHLRLLQ